jgi:hypothetical protein
LQHKLLQLQHATNSAANGAVAVATTAVAPRTLSSAPTSVSAVGGGNQASLSWNTPASNGGAAITDYNLEFSSDDVRLVGFIGLGCW